MKIHFIGIGGIGVSALAKYYLTKDHNISGSDLVSSEITDGLKKLGAKIKIGGHKKENVSKEVDLVIHSPAVKPSNPEFKEAKKRKIKILSYPQALGELTKQHFTIAVSGTHGKSTTTAMISLILIKAGLDPTVIIGTKLKEFDPSTGSRQGSNCRVGKSKYLVIEADEHFASFLNYWPKIIVLTNIEADHLDYYKNLNNILKTFKKYIGHLRKDGFLILNWDDQNIKKISRGRTSASYSLGQPEAKKLKTELPFTEAKVKMRTKSSSPFKIQNYSIQQSETKMLKRILKIPGEHNVYNALAALTLARALKIPDKISFKALSGYNGAWRRFEIIKGSLAGKKITIISDYGHHPTKVRVTLKATREKYPKKTIWCVYQPHQYQRTYYLFRDFVKVFKTAPINKIIITDIFDVAGREEKEIKRRVNSEKLIKAINKRSVIYLPQEKILNYLKENLQGGEVVIIMGAGDIYNLCLDLTRVKNKRKIK